LTTAGATGTRAAFPARGVIVFVKVGRKVLQNAVLEETLENEQSH
jgi:hypothetical protein